MEIERSEQVAPVDFVVESEPAKLAADSGIDDWLARVVANGNRMAVDEDYRKLIAKNLS